jgi:hypothetical protein
MLYTNILINIWHFSNLTLKSSQVSGPAVGHDKNCSLQRMTATGPLTSSWYGRSKNSSVLLIFVVVVAKETPVTWSHSALHNEYQPNFIPHFRMQIEFSTTLRQPLFTVQATRYRTRGSAKAKVYLWVPYGSHHKQRLFPQIALTGWAL